MELCERLTRTGCQVLFELLMAVILWVCMYTTLNITLISSPSGSALTRANLRGTALELKKEQAYINKHSKILSCALHHTVMSDLAT